MADKHTMSDLYQMQSLSLSAKIQMTRQRIRGWIDEFGEDGVYVSFSGGKDSTVLLDIVRKDYPNVKAVFVDTGLEYPEIRQFVKTFDNVDWLKPKMNFRQVIEKYGYPFISKEVAECVYGAHKYLRGGAEQTYWKPNSNSPKYLCEYDKLCGRGSFDKSYSGGADNKYRKLRGLGEYAKCGAGNTDAKRSVDVCTADGAGDQKEHDGDNGDYP